jgi:hypothetical protein
MNPTHTLAHIDSYYKTMWRAQGLSLSGMPYLANNWLREFSAADVPFAENEGASEVVGANNTPRPAGRPAEWRHAAHGRNRGASVAFIPPLVSGSRRRRRAPPHTSYDSENGFIQGGFGENRRLSFSFRSGGTETYSRAVRLPKALASNQTSPSQDTRAYHVIQYMVYSKI